MAQSLVFVPSCPVFAHCHYAQPSHPACVPLISYLVPCFLYPAFFAYHCAWTLHPTFVASLSSLPSCLSPLCPTFLPCLCAQPFVLSISALPLCPVLCPLCLVFVFCSCTLPLCHSCPTFSPSLCAVHAQPLHPAFVPFVHPLFPAFACFEGGECRVQRDMKGAKLQGLGF